MVPLGRGASGEVWLAMAPGDVPVAIKRLFGSMHGSEVRRELKALNIIRDLRNPFLLPIHGFGVSNDQLHIVMTLAETDLFALWEARRLNGDPMTTRELLAYLREAAMGLAYLHSEKVAHGDVKPQNILVMRGHAQVGDFGLARLILKSASPATSSGTREYMAPELWRGKVCFKSDSYALACVFVRLYLGRPLFPAESLQAQMLSHIEGVPNLKPLNQAQQAVLRRALAKDPDDRFPSCVAFVEALAKVMGA